MNFKPQNMTQQNPNAAASVTRSPRALRPRAQLIVRNIKEKLDARIYRFFETRVNRHGEKYFDRLLNRAFVVLFLTLLIHGTALVYYFTHVSKCK